MLYSPVQTVVKSQRRHTDAGGIPAVVILNGFLIRDLYVSYLTVTGLTLRSTCGVWAAACTRHTRMIPVRKSQACRVKLSRSLPARAATALGARRQLAAALDSGGLARRAVVGSDGLELPHHLHARGDLAEDDVLACGARAIS